ncbi:MAG: hypothetical protein ACK421_08920 [Pseudanabaenaceae cyanobacterium]
MTEELVAITNQDGLKSLSLRQFLVRGEELDKKLSQYITNRLHDLFNQDFYV